jgi:hypothetical protein
MNDENWLRSMFSSKSGSADVINSTVLNITKWGAVLGAALTAISAGVEQVMDGQQFTSGNWTAMIISLLALVTMLFVADIAARAYACAHSNTEPVLIDIPVAARWKLPTDKSPHSGVIDAVRVSDGKAQMLVIDKDVQGALPTWIDLQHLV